MKKEKRFFAMLLALTMLLSIALSAPISVSAAEVIYGDANSDGVVNLKDVVSIRRYLVGSAAVTINETASDVNLDNLVNLKDVVLIKRYLAGGWNVTLGSSDKMFTITFVDYDGTVLSTQSVKSGSSATPPANPTRDGYVFTGWSYSYENITTNLTITARYDEIINPTFVVSSVNANAGSDNVEVTISMKNNPGITSIGMNVSFGVGLTLKSVTYNPITRGVAPSRLTSPTKLTWVDGLSNISDDLVFATLKFKVANNATGTLPITITYNADDVFNVNETNIEFGIVNGGITIN